MREKGFFAKLFTPGTPACAIGCMVVGAAIGLLLLWAGVWATLLVAALAAVGAFIGGVRDKRALWDRLTGKLGRK